MPEEKTPFMTSRAVHVQVGALVWTTCHSVQNFGVFLTIEGTAVNGLLHVSNISRLHVETPEVGCPTGKYVPAGRRPRVLLRSLPACEEKHVPADD